MYSLHRALEAISAAVVSVVRAGSCFHEFLAQATVDACGWRHAAASPAVAQLTTTQLGAVQGSAVSPVALALALVEGRVALHDGAQASQGQGCAPYPDG